MARGETVDVFQALTYFKLYCPCPQKHLKTVHLTPSGANYARNLRKWLERQSCWEADS